MVAIFPSYHSKFNTFSLSDFTDFPDFPKKYYLSLPTHNFCNEDNYLYNRSCFNLQLCLCPTNEYKNFSLPRNQKG